MPQVADSPFSPALQEELRVAIKVLAARLQREKPMARAEFERFESAVGIIVEVMVVITMITTVVLSPLRGRKGGSVEQIRRGEGRCAAVEVGGALLSVLPHSFTRIGAAKECTGVQKLVQDHRIHRTWRCGGTHGVRRRPVVRACRLSSRSGSSFYPPLFLSSSGDRP